MYDPTLEVLERKLDHLSQRLCNLLTAIRQGMEEHGAELPYLTRCAIADRLADLSHASSKACEDLYMFGILTQQQVHDVLGMSPWYIKGKDA